MIAAVVLVNLGVRIGALPASVEDAEFRVLRGSLDVSDSVLSKHLRGLEEATEQVPEL